MDAHGILQILLFATIVLALTPVLGGFMARVYEGRASHCAHFSMMYLQTRAFST